MSRYDTRGTARGCAVNVNALLTTVESEFQEFVEIPLGDSDQSEPVTPLKAAQTPVTVDDGLDADDNMFEDRLIDPRKVYSHTTSPPQKQRLVLSTRTESGCKPCCHPRSCPVGMVSSLLLLAQKAPLGFAFLMVEEDWTYGVVPGLLMLSFLQDCWVTSSRVYDVLNPKKALNTQPLYQKGPVPQLPVEEGQYGIAKMMISLFGILATSVLVGYAETEVVSPSIDSMTFKVTFCVLAGVARVINQLERDSIATISHRLLASETAKAPVFTAFMAEIGAKITYYRDYFSALKGMISSTVCTFLVIGVSGSPSRTWGRSGENIINGLVVFTGLLALMGDNYRTNRLNIKKNGLKPKNKCEQVGRQILNMALPYQLMKGITSIYRHSLAGSQRIMCAIPPVTLALSTGSGVLSLMEDTRINLVGDLSLNALLLGSSLMMALLSILSFIRIRYESAVSLVSGNAYDSLLSAYWVMKLSQHPVVQPVLGANFEDNSMMGMVILLVSFIGFMLSTSHTDYFIDQVIATRALADTGRKKARSKLQLKAASQSFDSPPSWRKSIFKERSSLTFWDEEHGKLALSLRSPTAFPLRPPT